MRRRWFCTLLGCSALLMLAGAAASAASFRSHDTPLIRAVRTHDVARVRSLIASGVDLNARDEYDEQTALMWAAGIGDAPILRALIDAGARPDLVDDEGRTALSFAESNNHADAASMIRRALSPRIVRRPARSARAR